MSGESNTHPLQVLSVEAQSMLSALLNPQKIVPTDGNLPRYLMMHQIEKKNMKEYLSLKKE